MGHSSLTFFFSSSTSYPRLTIIISLFLLNPLSFIDGTPTKSSDNHWKLSRQKRRITFNHDGLIINEEIFIPKQELVFERLLGCKFDSNICNRNEACFDDGLFGRCWNGKGSLGNTFTKDKLQALEYTFEFLIRYHLDWKDYMTQCILSYILNNDHQQQLNRYRLELFYQECLNEDEVLDEFAKEQKENDIHRGEIKRNYEYYHQVPYVSLRKSENFYLDKSFDVPSFNGQNRLSSVVQPEKEFYIDDEDNLPEESITNKSAKVSVHINEGHPSLAETLHISPNKPFSPISSDETIVRKNLTNNNQQLNSNDAGRYMTVETARGYIKINRNFKDQIEGARLLALLAQINSWPITIFNELNTDRHTLTFHVLDNIYRINASHVASSALNNEQILEKQLGLHIIDSGIGNPDRGAQLSVERPNGSPLPIITLFTCALAIFILGIFTLLYLIKRNDRFRNKFAEITRIKGLSTDAYQDLCRQRIHVQSTTTTSCTNSVHPYVRHNSASSSPRTSISSWIEDPVPPVNMDIITGHLILSYMEDHLRNRHRLEAEWQSLCTDETNDQRASCKIALSEINEKKNRYIDYIPYDHTRIRLTNIDDGDYINASAISDCDPKCKYIATQGPIPNTTNAFWQMVWEQGSCVIVALTRPIENGITMCHHYWPVEGSARFNDFEVNLVSEHIWSDDYVVRSLYLKNLLTMESRTVTQFHFLTWDELCNPPSARSVLDFRRKVNKCFRGQSSPIIVHCNDGVGRTGTYILLDIVLNRIYKGAREINIAATLEHIRDQRAKMVKTKEQFQFVFLAVAEEVTHLINALPR